MPILAGRLRYPHRLLSRISWLAEVARTCWLNWGRVPPQREELPLAVATVQLSPPLEQLVPLAWLEQLVPLVWLEPLVLRAWLVPWVLQGGRVLPSPVAWLRGPVHP